MVHDMANPAAAPSTCAGCFAALPDDSQFCPRCGTPRATATDPLLGQVLGDRYRLARLIGRGATGVVYEAEQMAIGRKLAVKVLAGAYLHDDLALERFRREAQSVGSLSNQHITQIIDFGRAPNGHLYFAMELLTGEPLKTRLIRQTHLSPELTRSIMEQIAEGLADAHAAGFVHRNLTSRNVFLTREPDAPLVKLLDFGLSKLVDADARAASTSVGMTFGDPLYMSPEQARGERIDQRADLYQVGCLGFEMLTGATPFAGGHAFDVLSRHIRDSAPSLRALRPDIPEDLARIIDALLAKRPDDRPTTARDLLAMLQQRSRPSGSVAAAGPVVSPAATLLDGSVARINTPPSGRLIVPTATRASSQHEHVSAPRAAGTERPAGPSATPAQGVRRPGSAPTDSGAWYEEGERASQRAVQRKPANVTADSLTDDYREMLAKKRRFRRVLIAVGVTCALAAGALYVWSTNSLSSDAPSSATNTPQAPAQQAPAQQAPATPPPGPAAAPALTPSPMPSVDALSANPVRVATVAPPPAPTPQAQPSAEPASTIVASATPPKRTTTSSSTRTPSATTRPDDGASSKTPTSALTPEQLAAEVAGTTTPAQPSPAQPSVIDSPPTAVVPADPLPFVRAGQEALANGQVEQAAAAFGQALAIDAGLGSARAGLGEVALRQGQLDDAIRHFRRASQVMRSTMVHTMWGEALLQKNDRTGAATQFKEALRIDADNARARTGFLTATAE